MLTMNGDLTELLGSLAAYDRADLASGVGGLQLLPIHAERQLRFERAAALIYSGPYEPGRPKMSAGRWRRLLNDRP